MSSLAKRVMPIPSPEDALIAARAVSEGVWLVPLEMALFCTTSALKAFVQSPRLRPKKTAAVFARGNRFFAVVSFHDREELLLPLDCHTWENKR